MHERAISAVFVPGELNPVGWLLKSKGKTLARVRFSRLGYDGKELERIVSAGRDEGAIMRDRHGGDGAAMCGPAEMRKFSPSGGVPDSDVAIFITRIQPSTVAAKDYRRIGVAIFVFKVGHDLIEF